MSQLQESVDLLHKVLAVIDSTDPDSETYEDSGADSIAMLLELDDEIRDWIFVVTGAYPETQKVPHDFNRDVIFQETRQG
jgi:hypothetical protein